MTVSHTPLRLTLTWSGTPVRKFASTMTLCARNPRHSGEIFRLVAAYRLVLGMGRQPLMVPLLGCERRVGYASRGTDVAVRTFGHDARVEDV
jgi:hypothetical protein